MSAEYPFVSDEFIALMNDIGRYGHEKFGVIDGRSRERLQPEVIAEHARQHFAQYLFGFTHDHFNTRRHQLAAVAFNAMMEFLLLEEVCSVCGRRFDHNLGGTRHMQRQGESRTEMLMDLKRLGCQNKAVAEERHG